MKNIHFILLTWVLLLPTIAARAGLQEPTDVTREIAGAVGSYLPPVAQSKQNTWELVKVVTDRFSGCATPSGLATISGSYTVVQQIGAPIVVHNGRYSWSQPNIPARAASIAGRPAPEEARWLESTLFAYRSDGEMPQSATRFLLCILHEKATGQDMFTNVHLVPDSWREDVLPAVLYLRKHPQLNNPKTTSASLVQARSLLHNANPYLVLTALQLLASNKDLTPIDMDAAFATSDARVIACSLVVAHLYSWSDLPSNVQWLKAKVAAIQSLNQLEGVAFGLFTIAPYSMAMEAGSITDLPNLPKPPEHQETRTIVQNHTDLLPLVRQKLAELDPNGTTADEQWRNIDQICRQHEMMQKYLPKPQPAPDAGQKH